MGARSVALIGLVSQPLMMIFDRCLQESQMNVRCSKQTEQISSKVLTLRSLDYEVSGLLKFRYFPTDVPLGLKFEVGRIAFLGVGLSLLNPDDYLEVLTPSVAWLV